MADEIDVEAVAALRKKRQFKKFTFRGTEIDFFSSPNTASERVKERGRGQGTGSSLLHPWVCPWV